MITRREPRGLRRAAVLGVAVGFAALAAAAYGFVTIYKNPVATRPQYREIETITGGNKCHREHKEKNGVFAVLVREGPQICRYKLPVQGNSSRPDHRLDALGRIHRETPAALRSDAYISILARVGGGSRYEFRVFPKDRTWQLRRQPGSGAFPVTGNSGDIEGIGKPNKLRLIVTGDRIRAAVNGTQVADVTDANPNEVDGSKLEFAVGSVRDTKKNTAGTFDRLKVSVPNP